MSSKTFVNTVNNIIVYIMGIVDEKFGICLHRRRVPGEKSHCACVTMAKIALRARIHSHRSCVFVRRGCYTIAAHNFHDHGIQSPSLLPDYRLACCQVVEIRRIRVKSIISRRLVPFSIFTNLFYGHADDNSRLVQCRGR
jgi:hypothetical protein